MLWSFVWGELVGKTLFTRFLGGDPWDARAEQLELGLAPDSWARGRSTSPPCFPEIPCTQ